MTPEQIIQTWQKTPQPKVHFSPSQRFVPKGVHEVLEVRPELDPAPHQGRPIAMVDVVETVNRHYTLPFQPYDYQAAAVNALSQFPAVGLWLEVGAGKTCVGTLIALYHRVQHPGTIIVVMPPILLNQWAKFFRSIPEIQSVLIYRGTPVQRKAMNLDVDVLLVSMDIFKNDFQRLYDFYYPRHTTLIVDEAVSVKNPDTMNHRCVWAWHNQDLTRYNITVKRKADAKLKRKGKPTGQTQRAQDVIDMKRKIMERYA